MTSLAYDDLGGISSVTENPNVPSSMRSRDRNDVQRMAFQCDPTNPFTGTIHIQASVGDPNIPTQNAVWFDIAEMIISNEGGTWSYEARGEFSSLRVICRPGNYWSAAYGRASATIINNGTFTINGIPISVTSGNTALQVAAAITNDSNIQADGHIKADTISTTKLRIYRNDGMPLILTNTSGTPLTDMGIGSGTYHGGAILSIRMLR